MVNNETYETVLLALTHKRLRIMQLADKTSLTINEVAKVIEQMVKEEVVSFDKLDDEAALRFTLR